VQGVAGSGKTSIALHRIAYLLYQNRETLRAEDVLILSPNKLFSEYIADVLPELGEENMSQMSFYRFAQDELKFLGFDLEKREDNIEEITKDLQRLNEVAFKNSYDFYENLKKFCDFYFNLNFKPKDLWFGALKISADTLQDLYSNKYASKSPAVRLDWLVDYILDQLNLDDGIADMARKIKNMLMPFFEETNILKIYADFLTNIGMVLSLNSQEKIRYDDLAPLLYITNFYFGLTKRNEVKYLIIDEMQDYSFVHYSIFNDVFDCKKIFLGDINQSIENKMTKQDLQTIAKMFNMEYVEMNKSYRSTAEITNFANEIMGLDVQATLRHGQKPKVYQTDAQKVGELVDKILQENGDFLSCAVLTSDKNCAKNVYQSIKNGENVSLNLNYDEKLSKICIMPWHMSKGLEFDVVIVVRDSATSVLDKNDYSHIHHYYTS